MPPLDSLVKLVFFSVNTIVVYLNKSHSAECMNRLHKIIFFLKFIQKMNMTKRFFFELIEIKYSIRIHINHSFPNDEEHATKSGPTFLNVRNAVEK